MTATLINPTDIARPAVRTVQAKVPIRDAAEPDHDAGVALSSR